MTRRCAVAQNTEQMTGGHHRFDGPGKDGEQFLGEKNGQGNPGAFVMFSGNSNNEAGVGHRKGEVHKPLALFGHRKLFKKNINLPCAGASKEFFNGIHANVSSTKIQSLS